MKIAYTSDVYWPRINGVTVSTNIYLNEMSRRGHQMRLWVPRYPRAKTEKGLFHEDTRVVPLPSFGLFFSREDRLPRPSMGRRFFRGLDQFGPDLIHVQTEFVYSFFARRYSRKRSVPLVMTCHTYFEQYIAYYFPWAPQKPLRAFARWMTQRLFRHADAVIAPTEPMKKVLESYGFTCPIVVIPTGLAADDFQGLDKQAARIDSPWFLQYPFLRGQKVLLTVGRIGQEKNLDFLLNVMERLSTTRQDVFLLVAGNGPYLRTFQHRIRQRGLEQKVLCLGYVPREQLKSLYTLADVFSFASITETQGLVTIEAMLCGTPVVAIGEMGTKEVMGGNHGGFMVSHDVTEFSHAVTRLLDDPDLYQKKSDEARSHAQQWTAPRMADRLERLYQTVVSSHREKPSA